MYISHITIFVKMYFKCLRSFCAFVDCVFKAGTEVDREENGFEGESTKGRFRR